MALGPVTAFASLADLLAAFTADIQTGTSGGRWRFDPGGSTQTSSTGPGTNNGLDFVHTETSGGSLTGAEAAGLAEFATVPAETGRMLHLRLCIQGAFGDGTEGLEIQQRASADDAWAMVTLITGWLYSDSRIAGDTVADFAGEDQTVAASGGWVDFTVAIPDTAAQVRLQPRYIQGEGSTWEHDIALRSFQWEYDDATGPSSLDAEATLTGGLTGSIVAAAALDTPGLSTPPILVGDSAPVTTPAIQVRFLVTTPRVLIDAGLVENDGVAYFGNLQLYLDRTTMPIGLRIAPDLTTGFGAASPNLTPAWEESIRALIITAGGHTLEIPGPTHSSNQDPGSDSDEPYDWLPSVAKVAEIQAWITTFRALSDAERDATTLTLSDGLVPAPPPLDAAASLTGGLAGSIVAAAELSPLPLQAAAVLTGGLTGSIRAAAALVGGPLNARAVLTGGLTGAIRAAAALVAAAPLNARATLTGGLTGAIRAAAALSGGTPLNARAVLTGRLDGSIVAGAELYTALPPQSAMRRWLLGLRLPWSDQPERWKLSLTTADLAQRLVDAAVLALREWWPGLARDRTLTVYGAVLARPRRREGESITAWRNRLQLWRQEAVGTTGWVQAEVQRITGARRVIDYPRDSMRYDVGRWDVDRYDDGPALVLGATAAQMAELRDHLDVELPPDIGLIVLDPTVFDGV